MDGMAAVIALKKLLTDKLREMVDEKEAEGHERIGTDFEATFEFVYRYCRGKRTQQFIKDDGDKMEIDGVDSGSGGEEGDAEEEQWGWEADAVGKGGEARRRERRWLGKHGTVQLEQQQGKRRGQSRGSGDMGERREGRRGKRGGKGWR